MPKFISFNSINHYYKNFNNIITIDQDGNDELDQQQKYHSGYLISGTYAQSFRPTLEILTRVKLWLIKGGGGLTISIRQNLLGEDLTSLYLLESEIISREWTEFDFPDIVVIPEQTYYIVYEPDYKCYWEIHSRDPYERGFAWKYLLENWEIQSDLDFSFKTYGMKHAPNPPVITGPISGIADKENIFYFSATDPDDDNLFYYIEWGDGQVEDWIGPYDSDKEVTVSHSWNEKGNYNIRAKVKDVHGVESDWSEPLIIYVAEPAIIIEEISSGLGRINVIVKNVGDAVATELEWSIDIEGLVINPHTGGTVEFLEEGTTVSIQSDFIFGFGMIEITILIDGVSENISGRIIGPIILI